MNHQNLEATKKLLQSDFLPAMGRRFAGKQRGVLRGVAKYKIKSKALKAKEDERTLLGLRESIYFSLGRKCFEFWFYCCGKLYLAPFTRTETGEYVPLDRKSMLIHYVVWFVKFLVLLHKLVGTVRILLDEELKIQMAFMCACQFLVYFVSFGVSMGMIARPKETMDVLNSWPFILSCLKELRGTTAPAQYDVLSTSSKLIAVLVATQGIALMGPLFSLIYSTIPTCYFPMAESLGLIPEGLLPGFAWQLILSPLEYITYLSPMLSAPLSGSILLILEGVLSMVGHELR